MNTGLGLHRSGDERSRRAAGALFLPIVPRRWINKLLQRKGKRIRHTPDVRGDPAKIRIRGGFGAITDSYFTQ